MPSWDFFAPIGLFAFSAVMTPGPNKIIIATSAVNFGFKKSAPVILGVCFGFSTMVLVVAAGGGLAFSRDPLLHDILRWVSVAFMCYLAWKIATARIADEKHDINPPSFFQMIAFQ